MKFSFDLVDLFYISPAITLFLFSLVPIMAKAFNKNKEPGAFASLHLPVIGGVIAAGLSIAITLYSLLHHDPKAPPLAFSGAIIIDSISMWMSVLICILTCFTLIIARENPFTRGRQFSEFVFLLLNCAVGMQIVAWSNDLIMTFIGIEIMSLCLYILIALSNESKFSKESAIKYFVLGSFASAIFIYGIAFIFGTGGTTYLHELTQVAQQIISVNRLFMVGCSLVILGLAFKVSLFPFHAWTPDVYQGSATPLTGFMATAVKAVTFVAFLRFISIDILSGTHSESLLSVLQWMAAFTILVGNIGALMQSNLKRMLAYSSVAHSGYIFIGLIVAGSDGGQPLGATGVLFYILGYSIMTLGAFACLSLFERDEESRINVDDLKGLSKHHPYVAAGFSIILLSLAGIPLTVGFFGKFYLFTAAMAQGFFWLAIWGVIGSVISVYYYLRPLVVMYMSDEEGVNPASETLNTRIAVIASVTLILVVGVASQPFYDKISASVLSLF